MMLTIYVSSLAKHHADSFCQQSERPASTPAIAVIPRFLGNAARRVLTAWCGCCSCMGVDSPMELPSGEALGREVRDHRGSHPLRRPQKNSETRSP
jgi:hypothetical protein